MGGALLDVAQVIAVVGAGLMAGLFFAFSVMVMPALRRQSVKRGMTVMQAINATANTPLFGAVFLLPGVACVVVAAGAVADQEDPGAGLSLVGALAYLGGVIVLTFVYHVPRNNRLDKTSPAAEGAPDFWRTYLSEWTVMNHVRLAPALISAVTLYLGGS